MAQEKKSFEFNPEDFKYVPLAKQIADPEKLKGHQILVLFEPEATQNTIAEPCKRCQTLIGKASGRKTIVWPSKDAALTVTFAHIPLTVCGCSVNITPEAMSHVIYHQYTKVKQLQYPSASLFVLHSHHLLPEI